MTTKKELKKKYKKLKAKVSELEDITMGTLWAMRTMISIYDHNMETIQKIFEMMVEKFIKFEMKINPLSDLDTVPDKEDATG